MRILLGLLFCAGVANAGTFATMPNQANGKIVLTDEACVHNGKNYANLNRAYNYGSAGYTQEGCWIVEDETVVVIWIEANQKMRYPLANFTINPNWKRGGGRGNSL